MDSNNYNNIQDKTLCNNGNQNIIPNNVQMPLQQAFDSGGQNVSNLLLPISQASTTNPLLSYQNSSFGGLYSSASFNSLSSSYDNNMQWLTDNRIQNQHCQASGSFSNDKTNNLSTHVAPSTTSNSCCLNRFGVTETSTAGISNQKTSCEVSSFPNKSNISMNVIDPIQTWLNFQIPNNQQYCKYGERSLSQNYSNPTPIPPQLNLPLIDQSDLKQSDLCIQSPDNCFDNVSTTNTKQIEHGTIALKQNLCSVENKETTPLGNNSIFKQQSSYQTNIIAKDWKSTFQSMPNYIPSPNMFSATSLASDSQENFIFPQYNMTNSFYTPSENYAQYVAGTKNNRSISASISHSISEDHNTYSSAQNVYATQNNSKPTLVAHSKPLTNTTNQYVSKKVGSNPSSIINNCKGNDGLCDFVETISDCCEVQKTRVINLGENNNYNIVKNIQENKCRSNLNQTLDIQGENNKSTFKSPDGVSSESEESNIIVEESDDIGEIESEISMEEIKKSYKGNEISCEKVFLKCLVCNMATSTHTPANHFVHTNESFPVTSTKTPVITKLEQILPVDLHHYLKVCNSFMCRRCLNLIETVEVLEVELNTAKKSINESFSKTIQLLVPDFGQFLQDQNSETLCSENENKLSDKVVEKSKTDAGPITASDSESRNEFQCSYCLKVLSTQETFKLHLQQHTKEFNFYCERCGKGFPLKSTLERHLNCYHGPGPNISLLCEMCGDMFSSKCRLHSHQTKSHSDDYRFKCGTCGKGFMRKVSLDIHSHKHTGTRSYICEHCGITVISKSHLQSHIKLCTDDCPYKCKDCGKSFVTERELGNHQSLHTGVYKLLCSVCGKGFNKPSNLKNHMISHSSKKEHRCSECDKAFKTLFNLNYHTKVVHKQDNVFKCSVCGKILGQQHLLQDHMNSHTKEKPYNCTQCGKRFVHQSTFITHLKTHTGHAKERTCTVCGNVVKTRMSVHMRSHTGERPYKCTYCPLAFSVSSSLKNHMERKHCSMPL